MLRCLRLRGTSRAQILFDLCLLRGKNPLWLSNVSHSFFPPPVNLVYRCRRVFICEWKWLWRRHALLYPNNNTYFFHFMVFTDHGEEEQSKSTRSLWETLGFFSHIYLCINIWFGLKLDVGLQIEPGASRKKKKFYFDLLVNQFGVNGLFAKEEPQERCKSWSSQCCQRIH